MSDTPMTACSQHGALLPWWTRNRHAMGGTLVVRQHAEMMKYLPRFDGESDDNYGLRLNGAVFYNGFGRTVEALVGLSLQVPPSLNSDCNARFKREWKGIDIRRRSGEVFLSELLTEGMGLGCSGIFVDMPNYDGPLPASQADEEFKGLRPYWRLIKGDDVWHIGYRMVKGEQVVSQLVIREHRWTSAGRFGMLQVPVYREYVLEQDNKTVTWFLWAPNPLAEDPGINRPTSPSNPRQQLKKKVDMPAFIIETLGTVTNQTRIPFAAFAAGVANNADAHPFYRKSALQDLCDVNFRHFNTDAALHWNLLMNGYGVAVREGMPPDKNGKFLAIPIGPAIQVDVPMGGKFYFAAPPPDAFTHQAASMKADEINMGTLGMTFVGATNDRRTGQEMDLDPAHATLRITIMRMRDCVHEAMRYHANYYNEQPGTLTFNTDFITRGLEPRLLLVLSVLNQRGQLTLSTLLRTIETGRLPDGFEVDKEMAEIMAEQAEREAFNRSIGWDVNAPPPAPGGAGGPQATSKQPPGPGAGGGHGDGTPPGGSGKGGTADSGTPEDGSQESNPGEAQRAVTNDGGSSH